MFQFKLRKPLESPLYIWPKNSVHHTALNLQLHIHVVNMILTGLFVFSSEESVIKSRPVEDDDEDDDEDNSGSGDNGESKLVFVLRSRHEALVGTMGTQQC